MLDFEAKAIEEAHVEVGDPDEGELGDEVASPAIVEHLKTSDEQEDRCDVVAEAILAGKEVEEFSLSGRAAVLTLVFAPVARFAEDFFVGNGPGDGRDGKGEKEEVSELPLKCHRFYCCYKC